MAAATVTRTEQHSMGDLKLYVVTFSSIADTNTYASGISDRVVAWWGQLEANESTAGDEGVNVSESSGTFSFFLKTTGAGKLFIVAIGG